MIEHLPPIPDTVKESERWMKKYRLLFDLIMAHLTDPAFRENKSNLDFFREQHPEIYAAAVKKVKRGDDNLDKGSGHRML